MKNYIFLLILIAFTGLENGYSQNSIKSSGQIPILGWYGIPPEETTASRYAEMKESGFNLSLTFFTNASQVEAALDSASESGMKIIISCPELEDEPENTANRFMSHPALAGYFLRDEPNRNDFSNLNEWVRRINSVDNSHFCFINLSPNYASSSYLGTNNYREYVHSFMNIVDLPFYSFAHYPIQINEDSVRYLRSGWYENLEIFSAEAKQAGKPFWAFALTTSQWNYPVPTLADLRLQIYSNLAYGAQGIQYFTYWTPYPSFKDGPININGKQSVVYNLVKSVNKEIENLSDVFLGSKVVSVSHTGDSIPTGTNRLSELPRQINILETVGKGAVVSILEKDTLVFLMVVNRDFQDTTKLVIRGDSAINRIQKDGTFVPAQITKLSTIDVAPGDAEIFCWDKGDSIIFAPVKKTLVHLTLDYDLKDYSGNNYHATDAGAVATSFVEDPERGMVAYFEKAAHAVLPKAEDLKTGTDGFAYSLWIKCPPTEGTPAIISNKDCSDGNNKGFALTLSDSINDEGQMWAANFSDGSNNSLNWLASANKAATFADNKWHFIAVSCDRLGNMEINLDGKSQGGSLDMSSNAGNAYDNINNYPITLMQDGTGANKSDLSGYIDEVRIWNRCVASCELTKIFLSDTLGKRPETVFLPLDNDLKDASVNKFDAKDAGKVPTSFIDDPERGRVAYFERTAHAVLPKVDKLRFGTNDFSFSLWVKCATAPYDPPIISNKNWNNKRNKGFTLYTIDSNKAKGDLWAVNFGDGEIVDGGSGINLRWFGKDNNVQTIADNKWHFIAVSFDRDKTMDIYLDGKLMPGSLDIDTCRGSAHDNINDYPVTLMQDGTGKYYMDIPAYLDELRIWNRTLTYKEVSRIYGYSLKTAISEEPSLSPAGFALYPNPSNSEVNIAFNSETFGETSILVYNNTGVLIKGISADSMPGPNKTSFNVGGWVPGIYLVRVVSGSLTESARLVVTD